MEGHRERHRSRQITISLGGTDLYTIDEIREIAVKYKRMARQSIDPREKAKEDRPVPSLADAIGNVIRLKQPGVKNPGRLATRWAAVTSAHANRLLPMAIDKVGAADVEACLLRVCDEDGLLMHATMIELSRYLGAAFAWAVVHGYRNDNPAALLKSQLPKARRVEHQRSLPYAELAGALAKVKGSGAYEGSKLLLEFIALTAVRTGEARMATWAEFDLQQRTWTVPAERMKAGKAHTVPLSDPVLAILRAAKGVSKGVHVFASPTGAPLSCGTVAKLLRDLDIAGTPHGLRATFRTWAAECTDTPREICEAALAHATGNAVEVSYQRSDFLAKRRDLMTMWAQFVTIPNVIAFKRTA